MEYKGTLYGKVGKSYFPLVKTAEQVDKMESDNKQMLKELKNTLTVIDNIKSIPGYQDVGGHLGACKFRIEQLIKQATTI